MMFKRNQLDFFYGEEETSQRVWNTDRNLNWLYSFLKMVFLLGGSVILFRTVKQQTEMRVYADKVAKRVEGTGGRAIVNADKSVQIIMDGKVQEVIPSDDRRISNQETTLHSEGMARQHLRLAITHLV